jgi:putative transposase
VFPLVHELAAAGALIRVPVAATCRVLGFSKQAYYQWRNNPVPQRDWEEAHLVNAARQVHADDPGFGYRFIADELADQGFTASERRIWRVCSQHGIFSVFGKRPGRTPKAGPPVHDDLVQRTFTSYSPNTLWLNDITEHSTMEGKLYMCAVKDVFSNRIVGYSIDSPMKSRLAVNALRMAITRRNPVATVVHSDRGGQFRSRRYVQTLAHHGLAGSIGHGIVLLATATQRARHPPLEQPRTITDRDRYLDRAHLPPPPTTTHPRPPDTDRIRSHNDTGREPRGLNRRVNQTFSSPEFAREFVEFATSADGQHILAKNIFSKP